MTFKEIESKDNFLVVMEQRLMDSSLCEDKSKSLSLDVAGCIF